MILRTACLVFTILLANLARATERPNVVWLLSEDNSKHFLKLFDEHGAETPRIEALAKHGLVFEHAFSNSPVCSVARTTLMAGCYGPRIGTQFHRRSVTVPLPGDLRMFPAYLRQAGYYTSNNRKKDYNAIEGKGVWDASSAKASWRGRKADQPFFHMQSFGASHESSLHFSAEQMRQQKTGTDPDTVFIPPHHPPTSTFRYTYARYHDRIQQIDAQIGNVIDQLEEDGLLEDTFVFYFGDHGGVLPRSKGYVYETGLHVPLVVRVPKNWVNLVDAKLGTRQRGFVSFIDFGPSVLSLAGIKVPEEVDGRPFLGQDVKTGEVERRDEAFGYADRFDEKCDLVRSLRKGKFKYIRSYQPFNYDGLQNNYRYRMLAYAEWRELYRAGKLNARQRQFFEPRAAEALYDLERDPYETSNLAADPNYSGQLLDLRNRLADRVKDLPDLSLYPESHLVAAAIDNPTRFGQRQKTEIAALVDIADLSLLSFDKAQPRLAQALKSDERWQRYWGLIACSSHGQAATPMADLARKLASKDPELLVRVRAAEFLALIGQADPVPVYRTVLSTTESPVAANLILNSLVMLRDGPHKYRFGIRADDLHPSARKGDGVQRRMTYLAPK